MQSDRYIRTNTLEQPTASNFRQSSVVNHSCLLMSNLITDISVSKSTDSKTRLCKDISMDPFSVITGWCQLVIPVSRNQGKE